MQDQGELTEEERERYQWQLWVSQFGEAGQRRLKSATVFISRIGGVGGTVALLLAAAGVGRLVLAHRGRLRRNDLNRQLLMSTEGIGELRVDLAKQRLKSLNPNVQVELIPENVSDANVETLIQSSDVVVSAAPLFEERFSMNRAAVRLHKPLVDCAMYELEGRLLTVQPKHTACLACVYPEAPPQWQREFPVFAAVASAVGALAAMEAIKLVSGLGTPTTQLLTFDLGTMEFRKIEVKRRADCPVCGSFHSGDSA
jgi:molybdopterin-synthase adenylyltransferase